MKTVILCGGLGTRIRDVADDIPKPMIRVGGMPIIWHLMKYYASFGHTEFVLCMGYKGDVIRDFFISAMSEKSTLTTVDTNTEHVQFAASDEFANWSVTLANTGQDAMTGARIFKVREYLNNEPFMLTYGDGLSDINLDLLLAYHRSKNLTVTVTGVRPPAGRDAAARAGPAGFRPRSRRTMSLPCPVPAARRCRRQAWPRTRGRARARRR